MFYLIVSIKELFTKKVFLKTLLKEKLEICKKTKKNNENKKEIKIYSTGYSSHKEHFLEQN